MRRQIEVTEELEAAMVDLNDALAGRSGVARVGCTDELMNLRFAAQVVANSFAAAPAGMSLREALDLKDEMARRKRPMTADGDGIIDTFAAGDWSRK